MEQSQSDPVRQAMCATDGRARDIELVKPLGAQKIRTESQMPGAELKIYRCTAGCFSLVKSDCFYALILPFWDKKIFNLFLVL